MSNEFLREAPKRFKSLPSRGGEPNVRRGGGAYGQGLIRNVSVITEGEALGHDMWADGVFLTQVTKAINGTNKGLKSRWTHPSLSADGTGRFLGRLRNATQVGKQVFADLHFSRAAHSTPDGDLADWTMTLAEDDPEAFGLSISFEMDFDAMQQFEAENIDESEFRSPDSSNERNLPHVRLMNLFAGDVVDDPAANPNGLFHRDQQIAQEADAFLAYASGLSDEKPTSVSFGVDGDRAKQFFERFCESHNVQLQEKGDMRLSQINTEPKQEEAEQPQAKAQVEETTPAATEAEPDTNTVDEPTDKPAGDAEPGEQLSTGQKFLDAFGDQGGVWYAQGKSFDECQVLYTKQLREENESLKQKLSARRDDSEDSAVAFENGEKKSQGFSRLSGRKSS